MPARRVFAWEPEEQWTSSEEREKKIEELSRELDESMDSNSGKGCLKAYLVKNEVWHIADIDYELRVDYRKYLKSTYSDSAVRSYLRGMDKAKLYAIRKHANTLKGKQEMTKDVWQLEKLDIQVKQDLTRTTRIINFKEISQQDLREEVKKAIYFQLKTESIGTVKKEMTAIRRFSRYLKENNKEVDSCSKLDRKIMEEYLIYMKTEDTGTKRYRAELTRLRALLNMVADVYQYPQVKDLILNRDIPPDIRGEIKIYSDQELKRFNAFLTKVDVQTARLMLIHQMLGTRMSDTLTLRTDCLIEKDGETIIQIHQMKTHFYEKPISQELAALIKEAIRYREKEHGKGKYIFTSLSDPSKPMKYATVQQKITDKIYQENLRDDKGEYFGFGSHMYRHIYGMKLAEMHVDDWTIARLLGHRSLRNVKYYRKMSNKILADDTRKTRNRLSKMVLECLEGWEEEYEQIRFDDSLQ